MRTNNMISEDELDLMQLLYKNPKTSQRNIAKKFGFSIGKVNYCLKALSDIGFVKVINFKNSKDKLQYAYILTPKGIKLKTTITKKFLTKKQQEFDKLNSYINK